MTDWRFDDYWWEYVFAVTESGAHYKIYTKTERTWGEPYQTLWECYYSNNYAWINRGVGKEDTESEEPFVHINDEALEEYWSEECSAELEEVLACYDFDSKIKEFYMISNLSAEMSLGGAAQLFIIKFTEAGRECIIPTELEGLPTVLFQDLRLMDENVHHIAGLCVEDESEHTHLIDWNVAFQEFDGVYVPESELFDVKHYMRMVRQDNAYQMKDITMNDDDNQQNGMTILPKAIVLYWEYVDKNNVKLKQAPTVCLVDLRDERNLCNGTMEDLLAMSFVQEEQPVAIVERQVTASVDNEEQHPF